MKPAALWLALAAATAGATEPAAAPPPAPAEDAIAAARKDFAEIKDAGASPEQQKLAVSGQALSGFDIRERKERIKPPPWLTPEEPGGKPGTASNKSENWLLDAMNDPGLFPGKTGKKPTDELDPAAAETRAGGDLLATDRALRSEKEAANPGAQEAANGKKSPADASNPLVSFMAAWMSPQDYDLLKAGLPGDQEGLAAGLAGATADGAGGAFAPPAATTGDPGTTGANLNDSLSALTPRENPYLAEPEPLTSPSAGPAGMTDSTVNLMPTAAPAALPALPAPAPATATAAKANPAMDAVQKADEDDKYFKQLRRF